MNSTRFASAISATGCLLALALASQSAMAAPVAYQFSATGTASGSAELVALLGDSHQVSGQFMYDPAGSLLGGSGSLGFEPGYAIYAGNTAAIQSLLGLQGQVGGRVFSDVVGAVSVGNDNPFRSGVDILTINADPTPKVGQNTLPTDYSRQLLGFQLGDYSLSNVRLYWVESAASGDFLSSYALPGGLPAFQGTLALDFVRTADPGNTANTPYFANTVFIAGLTAQAAPVPEPGALGLALAGLAGWAFSRRRG